MVDWKEGQIVLPAITLTGKTTVKDALAALGDQVRVEEYTCQQKIASTWLFFKEPPVVADGFLLEILCFYEDNMLHCCSLLPTDYIKDKADAEYCEHLRQKLQQIADKNHGVEHGVFEWIFPWGHIEDAGGEFVDWVYENVRNVDMYFRI